MGAANPIDRAMAAPPGYLKDYVRELWRASYRALEVTDTLVVAAIVVIGLAAHYWSTCTATRRGG
jgi:hypothetical protein